MHNAGYCKGMHGFVGVHYVHMYIYTSWRLKDSSPCVQVSMHNLKLKTIEHHRDSRSTTTLCMTCIYISQDQGTIITGYQQLNLWFCYGTTLLIVVIFGGKLRLSCTKTHVIQYICKYISMYVTYSHKEAAYVRHAVTVPAIEYMQKWHYHAYNCILQSLRMQ